MTKPKKSKTADRHRSGFMVRLPEEYRTAMLELSRPAHRSLTGEILLALDEYLASKGKPKPASI